MGADLWNVTFAPTVVEVKATRQSPLLDEKKRAEVGVRHRNLMEIHQGKDQRVEHREHLDDGGSTNAAPTFTQRSIMAPVKSMLHRPLVADQAREPLSRTRFAGQAGPARDDFNAALGSMQAIGGTV